MQATEDLRTPAEYPIHRIVDVNADAGLDHRLDERLRQRCRTPAVEGHLDIDAALRGGDPRFLQRLAGGIVEQDEGFETHFGLGCTDPGGHRRIDILPFFTQPDAVRWEHEWIGEKVFSPIKT